MRKLLVVVVMLILHLFEGIIINTEAGAACNARRDIVIHQTDLLFSHPMSAVSVSVASSCPCHVTDIVASCSSAWDQSLVASKYISVNRRFNTCKLLPGQTLTPWTSPVSFVYQHSPALTDLVAISATFSACATSAAAVSAA